jgi:hypothetical protein
LTPFGASGRAHRFARPEDRRDVTVFSTVVRFATTSAAFPQVSCGEGEENPITN